MVNNNKTLKNLLIQSGYKPEEENEGTSFNETILSLYLQKKPDEASEILVKNFLKNNHIYSTKDDIKSEMWIYKEGIYIPNGETTIKQYCREILKEAYTEQKAKRVIEKIRTDTYIETEIFFDLGNKIKEEIPLINGILNIRTKELTAFTPKKIFFAKIPIVYDTTKKCPNIEKFFKETLKEKEDIKVMYELIGYCLLKDHQIERAFMFVGDGRNGKGKTLLLLKNFLGTENVCSVQLKQMTSDSSGLRELHNKLANLSGDLDNTNIKETGILKQVTGRDQIQAKRKFLRDIAFINYSKQIFACNELPKVFDNSKGFWSRWIILEFPYEFLTGNDYEQKKNEENVKLADTKIIDTISTQEEFSGLLNKALEGLDRLLQQQDFSVTKGTKEIKDLWIRKAQSFTAFCMDRIEEDYENYISKQELRKEFRKYCKKHKLKGAGDKEIKMTLQDLFGVDGEGRINITNEFRNEKQNKIEYDREQIRVWKGIKFKKLNVGGTKN